MPKTLFPAAPLLIVDDDKDLQQSFAIILRNDGINHVVQCLDSRQAMDTLGRQMFSTVLLDLNMPHVTGLELLPQIREACPDTPVIVVTGLDEVSTAVRCMHAGASDYLVKPVDEDQLLAAIRRAVDLNAMRVENARLKERLLSGELEEPAAFERIVTRSRNMLTLFQYIEAIAASDQPILITGETGVGKELIADAVHKASGRQGEFVPVNIAGLDDNVFSDTLFGHVRGAFTGAGEVRRGLIEKAADGTLFLDEIGDLRNASQVKLLRLLQEREFFPLGSDTAKRTSARIVVATNKDIESMKREGEFRDDLYYRLRSHHVQVPALRERRDDLPLLLDHFLGKAAQAMNKNKPTPPRELLTLLRNYAFPGNIRELEAMCVNAVSVHKSGVLSMKTFTAAMPAADRKLPRKPPADAADDEDQAVRFDPVQPLPSMREIEDRLIEEALSRTDGNQTRAAGMIGITRQTLIRHRKQQSAE